MCTPPLLTPTCAHSCVVCHFSSLLCGCDGATDADSDTHCLCAVSHCHFSLTRQPHETSVLAPSTKKIEIPPPLSLLPFSFLPFSLLPFSLLAFSLTFPSPSPSLPSSLLPPSPVREMRCNNYQSHNLIGHYHFWFTRLFLLVRGWGLGTRLSFLMERIFWSTPMTAHTEWLPGVQLKHFSTTCEAQVLST